MLHVIRLAAIKSIGNFKKKYMKSGLFKLENIELGNQILFQRQGIDDFRMWWTVVGFSGAMIRVKIDEMGYNDELFIDANDIESLQGINDTRYK